jgi:hypothetical protein
MQQKIMLVEPPVKGRFIQTSSIATRKAGGTMMASNYVVAEMTSKKADLFPSSTMNAKAIYNGRYNAMMNKEKKSKGPT